MIVWLKVTKDTVCWLPSLIGMSTTFKYLLSCLLPSPIYFSTGAHWTWLCNEFKNHVLNKVWNDTQIKISRRVFLKTLDFPCATNWLVPPPAKKQQPKTQTKLTSPHKPKVYFLVVLVNSVLFFKDQSTLKEHCKPYSDWFICEVCHVWFDHSIIQLRTNLTED